MEWLLTCCEAGRSRTHSGMCRVRMNDWLYLYHTPIINDKNFKPLHFAIEMLSKSSLSSDSTTKAGWREGSST